MPRRARGPDRGDVVWMNFTPQAGHEQAGHRPALVLSSRVYNERSGLMVCCPITSRARGYPFEVPLGDSAGVQGVVMADQLRSLDWQARRAVSRGRVDDATLAEVLARIAALLMIKVS